MTLSKQIKLLKALIDEVGNRPVIQYTDKWDFEPDTQRCRDDRPVREEVLLEDVLAALEQKSGTLFERFGSSASFREMCSVVRSSKCWKEEREYEDTKKLFDELHPDWEKTNRKKFGTFMGTLWSGAMPIRNIFR